jgi:hypothetical protein
MVGPTLVTSEYTTIPYSILDGPPLCIFEVLNYSSSHLVSNIRFRHFLYSILDAYQACIFKVRDISCHLRSNMWFTEVPILFNIRPRKSNLAIKLLYSILYGVHSPKN